MTYTIMIYNEKEELAEMEIEADSVEEAKQIAWDEYFNGLMERTYAEVIN